MSIYLLVPAAYLLGSISSAILVSRLFDLQDPRRAGSGNPGATNVLRLGGKKAAALTLAGDIVKGFAPVFIARTLTTDASLIAAVAFAAFIGHVFPIFFGFRGGKGVATAFGALAGLSGVLALSLLATWMAVAMIFRYSSLSAIVTAVAAPFYAAWLLPLPVYTYTTAAMTLLLLWRHRGNARNLWQGKEGKIGR